MNIISFSLWGMDLKYCKGALRNCELAKEVYPNWKLYFYIDLTVPTIIQYQLEKLGAKIIRKNEVGSWNGQQWRYEALDDPNAEYVIFRDCDSRLNYREKACVDEWIKSGKNFMNMRDHPWHQSSPILGGLWGAKKGSIENITQLIQNYKEDRSRYENDYHFLVNTILPHMKKSVIMFDEILDNKSFPKERSYDDYSYFVGEIFDENDKPNEQHRKILEDYLKNK